jgi:hypothetical protein
MHSTRAASLVVLVTLGSLVVVTPLAMAQPSLSVFQGTFCLTRRSAAAAQDAAQIL